MEWTGLDTRITLIAALCAVACSVVGVFLVLKRMSMVTHGIAHAVLPGIVLAFMYGGTTSLSVLLIGALAMALVTTAGIELLSRSTRLDQGAATGVVFTALFALGLLMLRLNANQVHLDTECVIEGQLTVAATDVQTWIGLTLPRSAWLLIGVLLLDLAFVGLFWKELVLSVFDPDQAKLQGRRPGLMHHSLMAMTAITTIAAFEAVGSILVVAMMVIPASTALMLSNRPATVLWLATLLGVASAFAGHVLAILVPGPLAAALLGAERAAPVTDSSSAGMIAVVQGVVFLVVALVLGRHTAVRRWLSGRKASGRRTAPDPVA